MARSLDDLKPRAALVEIARDFHARGWMAGTAGNLSARADDGHFWITASGKPKGRLEENDFLPSPRPKPRFTARSTNCFPARAPACMDMSSRPFSPLTAPGRAPRACGWCRSK